MEYVVTALFIALEYLFVYTFVLAFLPRKKWNYAAVSITLLAWAASLFYTQFTLPPLMKITGTVLIFFSVTHFLFSGSWYRQLLLTVLAVMLGYAIDLLGLHGGVPLDDLIARRRYYTAVAISIKLFAILLAWLLGKWRKVRNFHNTDKR